PPTPPSSTRVNLSTLPPPPPPPSATDVKKSLEVSIPQKVAEPSKSSPTSVTSNRSSATSRRPAKPLPEPPKHANPSTLSGKPSKKDQSVAAENIPPSVVASVSSQPRSKPKKELKKPSEPTKAEDTKSPTVVPTKIMKRGETLPNSKVVVPTIKSPGPEFVNVPQKRKASDQSVKSNQTPASTATETVPSTAAPKPNLDHTQQTNSQTLLDILKGTPTVTPTLPAQPQSSSSCLQTTADSEDSTNLASSASRMMLLDILKGRPSTTEPINLPKPSLSKANSQENSQKMLLDILKNAPSSQSLLDDSEIVKAGQSEVGRAILARRQSDAEISGQKFQETPVSSENANVDSVAQGLELLNLLQKPSSPQKAAMNESHITAVSTPSPSQEKKTFSTSSDPVPLDSTAQNPSNDLKALLGIGGSNNIASAKNSGIPKAAASIPAIDSIAPQSAATSVIQQQQQPSTEKDVQQMLLGILKGGSAQTPAALQPTPPPTLASSQSDASKRQMFLDILNGGPSQPSAAHSNDSNATPFMGIMPQQNMGWFGQQPQTHPQPPQSDNVQSSSSLAGDSSNQLKAALGIFPGQFMPLQQPQAGPLGMPPPPQFYNGPPMPMPPMPPMPYNEIGGSTPMSSQQGGNQTEEQKKKMFLDILMGGGSSR
ncbi:hypothetical protein HDV05_005827, partial [Chytridiales sp. JEL 0842]